MVTFTDEPRMMIYPASGTASTIRIVEDIDLPKSIELNYENIELKKITTSDDLSTLNKLEDRRLGKAEGKDLTLSLYSDSYNKVSGVFKYGDSQYILPDLGYSYDVSSIKMYDLHVNYENFRDRICLIAAVGSDIGYKYVFYNETNDECVFYHNWGTPIVTDINNDGISEILMQFEEKLKVPNNS